jgi:WD40 repeat protein
VIFSPDGKTLLASSDGNEGMIRRWDVATGKESGRYPVPGLSTLGVMSLLPDGKTLVVTRGSGLVLLDLDSGLEVRSPRAQGHRDLVFTLSYSQDGKSLVSTGCTETLTWDLVTGKMIPELKEAGACSSTFSPDGKTLCKQGGHYLELWDVAARKCIRRLQEPKTPSMKRSFGFSPDGKTLVLARTDVVRLYDVATGFYCDFDRITDARLSPDGKTLGALSKEEWPKEEMPQLELWDVATRSKIRSFELEKFNIAEANDFPGMEFSPDGKILAVGRHRVVCLLDVATGKLVRKLAVNGFHVCMAFSPDGKTLATADRTLENDVHLWETATGKEIGTLKGHRGGIPALAYSPDGKTLASACTDSTILIWDVSRWSK